MTSRRNLAPRSSCNTLRGLASTLACAALILPILPPIPALSPLHKAEEHLIGLHFRGPERTSEGQTSQHSHAGEGHIHLPRCKRPRAEIESHIFKGQTSG